MRGDRGDLEIAALEGAAIQALNVLQHVLDGAAFDRGGAGVETVEHVGIVGVGAVTEAQCAERGGADVHDGCLHRNSRSGSRPAPVRAETTKAFESEARSASIRSGSVSRSDLLNTITVVRGVSSRPSSTPSTAAICRSQSGSEASTTCSRRLASVASTSVLRN